MFLLDADVFRELEWATVFAYLPSGFSSFSTTDILGKISLYCGRLSGALADVQQHPWLLTLAARRPPHASSWDS